MCDRDVVEKLIGVLNKLERRLEALESATPDTFGSSNDESNVLLNKNPPGVTLPVGISSVMKVVECTEEMRLKANYAYIHYPPGHEQSCTSTCDRSSMHEVWTQYVGRLWALPSDQRLQLNFQECVLNSLNGIDHMSLLEEIHKWNAALGSHQFSVHDFDRNGRQMEYRLPGPDCSHTPKKPLSELLLEHTSELEKTEMDWNFCAVEDKTGRLSSQEDLKYATAPWGRLVMINGLTSLIEDTIKKTQTSPTTTVPARYSQIRSEAPIFNIGGNSSRFPRLLDHHITATFANPYFFAFMPRSEIHATCDFAFHVTSYMIFNEKCSFDTGNTSTHFQNEKWAKGFLYDGKTKIVQVAYTLYAAIGCTGNEVQVFYPNRWTIVKLFPRYYPTNSTIDDVANQYWDVTQPKTATISFLMLVYLSMLRISTAWRELVSYFDILFPADKVFMNPKAHDALLVDDGAFSRSRKYFWALTTLSEFEKVLKDTIDQWEISRGIWEQQFPRVDPTGWTEAKDRMERTEELVDSLRGFRKRFQDLHLEVAALRDGLFNASSVMESRDANQLGGNVKLLTFVSIFFLPLAFTSSIYSINNELFNPRTLPLAATIVGLVTYVLVFNLNNIVNGLNGKYQTYRNEVLLNMQQAEKDEWQKRGKELAQFEFKSKNVVQKPSEWWVFWYCFVRLLYSFCKHIKFSTTRKKNEEQEGGSEA